MILFIFRFFHILFSFFLGTKLSFFFKKKIPPQQFTLILSHLHSQIQNPSQLIIGDGRKAGCRILQLSCPKREIESWLVIIMWLRRERSSSKKKQGNTTPLTILWEFQENWWDSRRLKERSYPYFQKVKTNPGYCRTISLTSILAKDLEQIKKYHICKHLGKGSAIDRSQHRFVTNKLCQTNVISFLDRVGGLQIRGMLQT